MKKKLLTFITALFSASLLTSCFYIEAARDAANSSSHSSSSSHNSGTSYNSAEQSAMTYAVENCAFSSTSGVLNYINQTPFHSDNDTYLILYKSIYTNGKQVYLDWNIDVGENYVQSMSETSNAITMTFNYIAVPVSTEFGFYANVTCGSSRRTSPYYSILLINDSGSETGDVLALSQLYSTNGSRYIFLDANGNIDSDYSTITTRGYLNYISPSAYWGIISDGNYSIKLTNLSAAYGFTTELLNQAVEVRGSLNIFKGNVQLSYLDYISYTSNYVSGRNDLGYTTVARLSGASDPYGIYAGIDNRIAYVNNSQYVGIYVINGTSFNRIENFESIDFYSTFYIAITDSSNGVTVIKIDEDLLNNSSSFNTYIQEAVHQLFTSSNMTISVTGSLFFIDNSLSNRIYGNGFYGITLLSSNDLVLTQSI